MYALTFLQVIYWIFGGGGDSINPSLAPEGAVQTPNELPQVLSLEVIYLEALLLVTKVNKIENEIKSWGVELKRSKLIKPLASGRHEGWPHVCLRLKV